MKIVFAKIQDSTRDLYLTTMQYPINIGYLAQVCLDAGYEVDMWDFCVEEFTDEAITEKIRAAKPDILGVSCVTSAIIQGHNVATIAKNYNKDIVTLVGGVHVTALPEETMTEFPNFDLGVLTEAEGSILEICSAVEEKRSPTGIRGTMYREKDKLVRAQPIAEFPDVNAIPFANREILPMEWYNKKHTSRGVLRDVWKVAEIDSSRGCPYACTFCNVELTHGRKTRFRDPDNVLREVEQLVKKFGSFRNRLELCSK